VSRPTQRRRRLQALVLAAVAIGLVIVEPFPKGALLVSLTPTHGVDVGDLPALALLLVAACLAIWGGYGQRYSAERKQPLDRK
jgi:hypothetical protein